MEMTLPSFAAVPLTADLRNISNRVFGREYQLEIAAALAALDRSSTVEEIFLKARERAESADLEIPKESSVRTAVERLAVAGAVTEFPSPRPGIAGYFEPRPGSSFWDFALELCKATASTEGQP